MYEKELDLRMSTSYGPGRYDAAYEERRSRLPDRLRAVDREPQHGRVPAPHRRRVGATRDARRLRRIRSRPPRRPTRRSNATAHGRCSCVLEYGDAPEAAARTTRLRTVQTRPGTVGVAVVGAGAFAQSVARPEPDASSRGLRAACGRQSHRRRRKGGRRPDRGCIRDHRSRRGSRRRRHRPRRDRDAARSPCAARTARARGRQARVRREAARTDRGGPRRDRGLLQRPHGRPVARDRVQPPLLATDRPNRPSCSRSGRRRSWSTTG